MDDSGSSYSLYPKRRIRMNVTCPNCKNKFPGLAEPPFRAGTRWNCPKCNTTVTIPLYCPTCDPPAKLDKQFLPTPEGFLGGTTQQCLKGHKFVVKISLIETHERLRLFGGELGKGPSCGNTTRQLAHPRLRDP
jgi:hypothetical protein